ncbi:tyrosine-type recombinase/integrase [Roseomonas chloroacetimidivorans]|uniref:tyrosine-type recombinase/integrase n=1 Tax=Roseomonas chloroacetimidivorans TaxID=1766656 RepID=UPI003C785520
MRALLRAYERSPEFAALSTATQKHYLIYLKVWLDEPDALVREVTRRQVLDARDAIAQTRGAGAATAFGRVTAALFAWALDREWIEHSPATKMKALPGGSLPAWTEVQIAHALVSLPEALRRVVVLALHTGQRRGDLCKMAWAQYDGNTIRLRQGKTGTALTIPCHPDLRAELDAWKPNRQGPLILSSPKTGYWSPEHLTTEMRSALTAIGLPARLNVHGLRKAAARRLAEAGCSALEIAAITGHQTLAMVRHYTASADQAKLAEAAIQRLVGQRNTIAKKDRKNN